MKLWKIVPLEEMVKYRVGDRVYSPHFGEGIITDIDEKASPTYPIVVEWTKELQPYHGHRDVYTIEGLYTVSYHDPEFDITPLEAIKVSERGVRRREGGTGMIIKIYIALMDCLTIILLAMAAFLAAYGLYLLVLFKCTFDR